MMSVPKTVIQEGYVEGTERTGASQPIEHLRTAITVLDMFLPGLWAYRSILAGGIPMDIPNIRNKAEREKWRNDTTCCDKRVAGDMYVPAFSKGEPDIPDEVYENMRKKWQEK